MKAPFPWFGGKSRIADEIWDRFGAVQNYVEPFAGSAAMLLARPRSSILNPNHDEDWGIETINDADGMLANFWRSIVLSPQEVAKHAEWPINEADLHARHLWLVRRKEDITTRLMAHPDWHDPKAAGWWVWGLCSWIGQGWCSGDGPWTELDGEFVKVESEKGQVKRGLPHLGDTGRGINRKVPHLGAGRAHYHLQPIMERLKHVRVSCGDWSRVCGPSPTTKLGITAVFLDPPYDGYESMYSHESIVSEEVRKWCIERGHEEKIRVALCGYGDEHSELESYGWKTLCWETNGGYGNQSDKQGRENKTKEKVWLSPHCLDAAQTNLFE